MTKYAIYIDYDGGGYDLCYPDLIEPFGLEMEGKFIKRTGWGKIQFKNDPLNYAVASNDVYRLYDILVGNVSSISIGISDEIFIKAVTDEMTVEGYFSMKDCKFDNDRKIVSVTPAIKDKYRRVLENWEKEVDFTDFNFSETTLQVVIPTDTLMTTPDFTETCAIQTYEHYWPVDCLVQANPFKSDYDIDELDAYFNLVSVSPNRNMINDVSRGFTDKYGNSLDTRETWLGVGGEGEQDFELSEVTIWESEEYGGILSASRKKRRLYITTKFSRDYMYTEDVGELPDPPPGDGWEHHDRAVFWDGVNSHFWTRPPFNGTYKDDWELLDAVENTPSWDGLHFPWYKKRTIRLQYLNSDFTKNIDNSLSLYEYLKYLYQNTHEDLSAAEVESTFFFNDNEGDLDIFDEYSGYNYVTLSPNYLNNARIAFTRDIQSAIKINDISIVPKATLKDTLSDLNIIFGDKLYWFIDDSQVLHIEHIRMIDLTPDLKDITGEEELLRHTNKWEFDDSKMFQRIEYSQVNAQFKDFIDNIITFNNIASNTRGKENKLTLSTQLISTDLRYALENAEDMKDGVLLFDVDGEGIRNNIGIISGMEEVNGYFALSNLLYEFARYEGVSSTGTINGNDVIFKTLMRIKVGTELTLKGTQITTAEIPFYLTSLGYGKLVSGSIDIEREYTKLTLIYRYNSTEETDMFMLMVSNGTALDLGNY